MKLAILALVALSGVALAKRENKYEKEGHYYNHEERLGVFKNAPFVDLYKHYATAFVAPTVSPAMDHDDPRYYRPSVDICNKFFTTFVNEGYKIYDFDQFVVMDACLGYVMDGVYKEEFADPEHTKQPVREQDVANFDALAARPEVANLYKTQMGSFSPAEKTCVADLMLQAILARRSYTQVYCNNHMVQMYIQFAECQEQEGTDNLKPDSQDPYVKMVYDLLRERVDVCFEEELAHITNAVRDKFAHSRRFKVDLGLSGSSKQKKVNMWPSELYEVLSAVQNTQGQVNLRQVHQLLSARTREDDKMEAKFLSNLAEYATRKVNPRRVSGNVRKSNPAFSDPTGSERYVALMDNICNPFRISTSERHYSYALSLVRMVQLLQHKNLFNVDETQFLRNVVQKTYECGPVYLATYSCNLISFTQGSYSNTNSGRPTYKVSYKPDTSKMVVWPTVPFV